jgi:hypothetical protein
LSFVSHLFGEFTLERYQVSQSLHLWLVTLCVFELHF